MATAATKAACTMAYNKLNIDACAYFSEAVHIKGAPAHE